MSVAIRQVKTVGKKPSLKSILKDKKKRIRLLLLIGGVLLTSTGVFVDSYRSSPQLIGSSFFQPQMGTQAENKKYSFASEPVKVDKQFIEAAQASKKDKQNYPPVRIIIPSLSIDLPVKEAKVIDGFWQVFEETAGFGLGSAYPDETGNQVIFAHAREGLFLPLKNIDNGQIIYIMTQKEWYKYKVVMIKEVLPSQTEVIAPTKEKILTLYTCSGFADSKRLIVIAKPEEN